MLMIVESMQYWRHYLEGSCQSIQVLSDHKNLITFMSIKVLNHQQACWVELLTDYDFVLIHTPRKRNSADDPSCRPDYSDNSPPMASLIPLYALHLLPTSPFSSFSASSMRRFLTLSECIPMLFQIIILRSLPPMTSML
jgi:hypothetical protein